MQYFRSIAAVLVIHLLLVAGVQSASAQEAKRRRLVFGRLLEVGQGVPRSLRPRRGRKQRNGMCREVQAARLRTGSRRKNDAVRERMPGRGRHALGGGPHIILKSGGLAGTFRFENRAFSST